MEYRKPQRMNTSREITIQFNHEVRIKKFNINNRIKKHHLICLLKKIFQAFTSKEW